MSIIADRRSGNVLCAPERDLDTIVEYSIRFLAVTTDGHRLRQKKTTTFATRFNYSEVTDLI